MSDQMLYYDYNAEELVVIDKQSGSAPTREIKQPFADYSDELYERVGTQFTVRWLDRRKAEPVFHQKTVEKVGREEIENALSGMKSDGIL